MHESDPAFMPCRCGRGEIRLDLAGSIAESRSHGRKRQRVYCPACGWSHVVDGTGVKLESFITYLERLKAGHTSARYQGKP